MVDIYRKKFENPSIHSKVMPPTRKISTHISPDTKQPLWRLSSTPQTWSTQSCLVLIVEKLSVLNWEILLLVKFIFVAQTGLSKHTTSYICLAVNIGFYFVWSNS